MSRAKIRSLGLLGIIAVFLLFGVGCVVGPDYKPAKVAVPAQWAGLSTDSTGNTSISTPDTVSIAKWWKNFEDPELDSLVNQALQSNLGLQQAQARILQARENGVIAGSSFWPSSNASATNTSSYYGTSASAGNSGGSVRNLFQTGLDATWELDFFGGVRRGIEAANANTQASIADRNDAMVTLTAEVALNYMQLRGFQQEIAIARKNLEAQQQAADLAHKRFDAGFSSGLDVANAEAEVAATQSQIPVLEASAQQTIYNLSVLLGREPAALVRELSPEGAIPNAPSVVPVGLPSDLLERRPDIRRAEAQLHSATAQIGVAEADLFPKFSLTGSTGTQSLTIGSLSSLAGRFWSAGPGVSLPIFNAGKIRANVQVQKSIQQQMLLSYKQTILTALQDVESALIAYSKDQQHRAALVEAVKSNQKAVDLSTQLYTAGQGEFLNVLTAEHNLYSTEDALVQSERTVDTDLIALYKALGGGWE